MAVIVVMGVSGVGKTTVGQALASRIGAEFAEGDSYHPPCNVEKMRRGRPLDDDDRWPWLDRLRAEIVGWLKDGRQVVLTCSALKASYRDRLRSDADRGQDADGGSGADSGSDAGDVIFLHLHADRRRIEERLAARTGHYMPASLLESQLATLEPPEHAIAVDTERPLEDILVDLERLVKTAGRGGKP